MGHACLVAEGILYKVWDDGAVAFDAVTGETHRLEPVMAELLGSVRDSGPHLDQVKRRFADILGLNATDPAFAERVDEMLDELARLRLIRRGDP